MRPPRPRRPTTSSPRTCSPRPSRRTTLWRTRSRSWRFSTARPKRWERGSPASRNSNDPSARTIANTYHGLASWEKAELQWRAVLEAARQRDPQSAEAYDAQGLSGDIPLHRGRRDAEVLAMAEAAARGTRTHTWPRRPPYLAARSTTLACVYLEAGKLPEAIALSERVRDAEIAQLGPDHPDTLVTLNNLARAYHSAGRLPEAIALLRARPRREHRQARPRPPHTLSTLNNLAGRTRPPGGSPRRSPCSSASATPRSPSSARTTPAP